MDLSAPAFFDLSNFPFGVLFRDCQFAWQAIPQISHYLAEIIGGGGHHIEGTVQSGAFLGEGDIYIGPGTIVQPGAYIAGPTFIGANCRIQHGAYIRGNVILSEGAVVGHASEVKNSLLFPGAHAAHFNYVGDSILGGDVNLGAGTKLSNLSVASVTDPQTGRRPTIHLEVEGKVIDTGLTKLGAVLGDGVQCGCNSVLNPGTLVGPQTLIYANTSLPKGYYPGHKVIKLRQTLEMADRR